MHCLTRLESSLSLLKSIQHFHSPIIVRWLRRPKPYWIGTAKSKMFKFPPLIDKPKDEEEEMQQLEDNYKSYMNSLTEYMKERYNIGEAKRMSEARGISEEAEYDRIYSEIEKDNSVVRAIREEALVKEWNEIKLQILQTKEEYEKQEQLQLEQTEAKLNSELGRLKTAIPKDKLDEAIEQALSTEVDYNFAIDKKGNMFHGRITHIPLK